MKYLNMYSVWNLNTVLFAISIWGAESQVRCKTPSNMQGLCIDINACPTLYTLLQSPQRKAEDIKFLSDSKCGFTGSIPKVCCENDLPCTTPSGESGVCKKLESCPSLTSLIQSYTPNLPEAVNNYARDSVCQGVEQYSVCCGKTVPDFSTTGPPAGVDARYNVDTCGLPASEAKIIGGTEAAIDQDPWLALIEYRTPDRQIKLLCGAVLIGANYILTAGHCVAGKVLREGKPESVRLGEHDINKPGRDCQVASGGGEDCNEGHVSIPIEETVVHPGYQWKNNLKHNDIALVRLLTPAPYTDFIRHICMPTVDLSRNLESESLNFSVAGWGTTEAKITSNIKMCVDVPFITLEQCQAGYVGKIQLWEKQLCAGGVAGKDSCSGDSGGPLMYSNEQNRFEVVGIVSFGPNTCGTPGVPGVYSKVIEYMDWIRSVVRR